jgi:xanthine dehydrogenase accessory factor
MLVSPAAIFGTIGGGQLEFRAIEKARSLLSAGADGPLSLSVPLGPEIGQCCGGRVDLTLRRVDGSLSQELAERAERDDSKQPHVYIFGGGHVGHALSAALALLPVHAVLVETRTEALQGLPAGAATRLTAVPEETVAAAPQGSAFVVLTHDHALDFLIVAAALARRDAAYVGMIGSKTKKATFRSWFLRTAGGSEADFLRLVSPIGGSSVRDKRPAVIAALAAAEIMTALAGQHPQRR